MNMCLAVSPAGESITYNRAAFNSGESFAIRGGDAGEGLSISNVGDQGVISFDGRGGTDGLTVDDRLLSLAPSQSLLSATGLQRTGGQFSVNYQTTFAESRKHWVLRPSQRDYAVCHGRALQHTRRSTATVILGNNPNTVTLYPHDILSNTTINGNLGIIGGTGSDILRVDDAAYSVPINYSFSNPFGSGTQNLYGLGSAGLGTAGIENWVINAGTGNDTFAMNQFASGIGVTLNGGNGDDVCDFGNNNVPGNITSIASFLFNGEGGTDTFNLRNATPANSFTYAVPGNTTLQVTRSSPSYFVSLEYYNTEHKIVYAGPSADTMNITSFASGELEFHGAGGDDVLNLPASSDSIGRKVSFFGDAGTNNRIVQSGNTKAAATTMHVTTNTIGAFPGDNFFAAGGSMSFDLVQNITLRMGSGADVAYVAPNAVAAITVIGGNPTSAPGDSINLALGDAQNYAINGTPASGSVTSSNLKTLSYSGFESGPVVDDASPILVDADFNLGGGGAARIDWDLAVVQLQRRRRGVHQRGLSRPVQHHDRLTNLNQRDGDQLRGQHIRRHDHLPWARRRRAAGRRVSGADSWWPGR